MTNEEKAKEIAESRYSKRTKDKPANKLGQVIIMQACLKMAEWKEKQFEKFKKSWYLEGYADGKYGSPSQFGEETVSKDLDEAAKNYAFTYSKEDEVQKYESFKAGANWKKQQMMNEFRKFLNSIGRGQQFGQFERIMKEQSEKL